MSLANLLVMAAMLISAALAVRAKRLISSALWLAGTSGCLAVALYLSGASQAAVIELSVGAGLVTVLFLFSIGVAGEQAGTAPPVVPGWISQILVTVFFLTLVALVLPFEVVLRQATEAPFARVLWEQRGIDTLVQVVLIFSGVMGLLGLLAETKAPLDGAAAAEMAAIRDQELATLERSIFATQEEGK
jgi:NADH:ubiquinone oxidoreductase subunit 6 (subunit J)